MSDDDDCKFYYDLDHPIYVPGGDDDFNDDSDSEPYSDDSDDEGRANVEVCNPSESYLNHPTNNVPIGDQVAAARFYWNYACSSFMLRQLVEIVAQGQKTDKGFKDVHLNTVAKMVTTFSGRLCSGRQVNNHLRYWQERWVKVCKLKQMSGARWDEENYTITLHGDQYERFIKAHPKDAEFLNMPIVNYYQMQVIFGSSAVTGRYAMGSAQALGRPREANGPVDAEAYERGEEQMERTAVENKANEEKKLKDLMTPKRRNNEGGISSSGGLVDAINELSSTVEQAEGCKGIYRAVMDVPGFAREELMCALDHFMERKGAALVFLEMTEGDRILWVKHFLAKRLLFS